MFCFYGRKGNKLMELIENLLSFDDNKILYLFGSGSYGKKAILFYGEDKVGGFIDNDNQKIGTTICGKTVISLEQYMQLDHTRNQIIITTLSVFSVLRQLEECKILFKDENGRECVSVFPEVFYKNDVPEPMNIQHGKWPDYLKQLVDYEGKTVLEVGSRVVTGANFRTLFEKAEYRGFDYYEGSNVDIVGDAHKLSSYFNTKFDLIFSSAVFEHLAMPWIVAKEMIDLLKPGGYIFVETHYSYGSHERPWHFFQFSEKALRVLFSEAAGIKCIEAGASNPIIGFFSKRANTYLQGQSVPGLYCHSEFLGQKMKTVDDFAWDKLALEDVVQDECYPKSHK